MGRTGPIPAHLDPQPAVPLTSPAPKRKSFKGGTVLLCRSRFVFCDEQVAVAIFAFASIIDYLKIPVCGV